VPTISNIIQKIDPGVDLLVKIKLPFALYLTCGGYYFNSYPDLHNQNGNNVADGITLNQQEEMYRNLENGALI